jgi:hypothetical protein
MIPNKNIFYHKHGKLNAYAGKFAGLYVKQARKAIVDEMQAKGLLMNTKNTLKKQNFHSNNMKLRQLSQESLLIRVAHRAEQKQLVLVGALSYLKHLRNSKSTPKD